MSNVRRVSIEDTDGNHKFIFSSPRWEDRIQREVKTHPLKSFPGTDPNPPMGLDFGSFSRHYAIDAELLTNRQLNELKKYVVVDWYKHAPATLKIGTGASQISKTGVVGQLHVDWNEGVRAYQAKLTFADVTVFTI